jgi:hypothetical protein
MIPAEERSRGNSIDGMATPHPWEMAFVWDEFLGRWFAAIDSGDTETLLRFSCVDLISERVGLTRTQRSREGLIESLASLWSEDACRHEWTTVVEHGTNAVVEWTRLDAKGTRPRVSGVSFFEIREGTGMLQMLRTYENGTSGPPGPDQTGAPDR